MEILGKVLGTPGRVKLMRLFLLNKSESFSNKEITKRSQLNPNTARKEINLLSSVGFIKRKGVEWVFNPLFKYAKEFERLLITSDTIDRETLLNSLKKTGKLKLLLVSGVFIKNDNSRVDILVIGDRMKKNKIEKEIRKMEAEIGKELVYAFFDTKEFNYRLEMYDKLVRDILDFPHEILFKAKELDFSKAIRKPELI